MCNSFDIAERPELERALRVLSGGGEGKVPVDICAGGTAFPGTYAPVIVGEMAAEAFVGRPDERDRLLSLDVRELAFGWPVEWKRETLFNARLDSLLAEKEPWGDALAARRCVLPCEAFYESHRSEKVASPRTGKPVKRRYRFTAHDGDPLLLAAVYEGDAFSVATTEPNAAVVPVHDRMPLVLTAEEARIWLDPTTLLETIAALADRSAIYLKAAGQGQKLPVIDQPELPF